MLFRQIANPERFDLFALSFQLLDPFRILVNHTLRVVVLANQLFLLSNQVQVLVGVSNAHLFAPVLKSGRHQQFSEMLELLYFVNILD